MVRWSLKSQDIDRVELRVRLTQGLAGYRLAEAQIERVEPPPTLEALSTVRSPFRRP